MLGQHSAHVTGVVAELQHDGAEMHGVAEGECEDELEVLDDIDGEALTLDDSDGEASVDGEVLVDGCRDGD